MAGDTSQPDASPEPRDPAPLQGPVWPQWALVATGLPALAAILNGLLLLLVLLGWDPLASGHDVLASIRGFYRDDAYYCFDWARSVVDGRGPRVAGGAPTSGVHVLWELLLMLPALAGSRVVETAAVYLGGGAVLAAAALLGRLVSRGACDGTRTVGWATGLLLIGNPLVMLEAGNGQETGLGVLALVLLLRAWRAPPRWFHAAAVVATLARSDLFLFVVALALVRPGTLRARALGPALALGVYAATNLMLTGRPLQDSAEPMAWLFREHFLATDPGIGDWARNLWWWGRPVLLGSPFALAGPVGVACLLAPLLRAASRRWRFVLPAGVLALAVAQLCGVDDLLVPCMGLGLACFPSGGRARCSAVARDGVSGAVAFGEGAAGASVERSAAERSRLPGPGVRESAVLLAAAVGLVALHSLIRWYPRDYYWAPIAVAGVWAAGRTFAGGGPRAAATVFALMALLGCQFWAAVEDRPVPCVPELRESETALQTAVQHLEDVAPEAFAEGQRIGAFNSGRLSWAFGEQVVNLDGVVNRPAFEALREGRLGAWLQEQGIGWLCDNPQQFALDATRPHHCGAWFGGGFDPERDLVEWARFVDADVHPGDREGTDVVALYRFGAGEETPQRPPGLVSLRSSDGARGGVLVWVGRPGEVLLRDFRGRGRDGSPEVLAEAVPGVPLVISLRTPIGTTTSVFVRGREDAILHFRGPR